MTSKQETSRSIEGLSILNDMLAQDGVLEEFQAVAIKEVLAWQLANAMKERHLSGRRLVKRMGHQPESGERFARSVGRERRLDDLTACCGCPLRCVPVVLAMRGSLCATTSVRPSMMPWCAPSGHLTA